jgi:hypothetical protein
MFVTGVTPAVGNNLFTQSSPLTPFRISGPSVPDSNANFGSTAYLRGDYVFQCLQNCSSVPNPGALFLIDEPDIYLHSELQRQLLGLLRNLGPDILIATHSTEIVSEAETDDIVLVNKRRRSAQRIRDPSQLRTVFAILGSNLNPILTQLAKTRRVLFVEGEDFQIFSKLARKLGKTNVAIRRDFAVVSVDGFNPDRIRYLKTGMEETLGGKIIAIAVLDRDYRSDDECAEIAKKCEGFCNHVKIHTRKEIENFLLVPEAIDRALKLKMADMERRSGNQATFEPFTAKVLDSFSQSRKVYVGSQYVSNRRSFERRRSHQLSDASVTELALNEYEKHWARLGAPLDLIPGKEALTEVNRRSQEEYGVSVTASAIIDAMATNEIPQEMVELIGLLMRFSSESPDS